MREMKPGAKQGSAGYGIAAFIALLLFVVSGCNKTETGTISYQYEYYPYQVGHYVAYDVDSIAYSYSNPKYFRDTVHYQLKEEITDTFYDNENQLSYRLELSRRNTPAEGWSIWKVWYIKPTATNMQKVEDDVRFIKLVFPPHENETWNGNLYVPTSDNYDIYRNWNYTSTAVHQPYSINGLSFDSTITVTEVDEEDVITKTLRREVYAKHVGLIYQEWEDLHKQLVNQTFDQATQTGFRIRMRVFDHN